MNNDLSDLENPIHRVKAAFRAARVMSERYAENGDHQNGIDPNDISHTMGEAEDRIAELLVLWTEAFLAGRKAA